jgi:hypothetical protein
MFINIFLKLKAYFLLILREIKTFLWVLCLLGSQLASKWPCLKATGLNLEIHTSFLYS